MERVTVLPATEVAQPLSRLSRRERQLLALMAAGRSNADIARQLWLSPKTVESHVRSIFAKLGLGGAGTHRRVAAVLIYLESLPAEDADPQARGVRAAGGSRS